MGDEYVKPSSYGPSFAFEFPSSNLTKDIFETLYIQSFTQYNLFLTTETKKYLTAIMKNYEENGVTVALFNLGMFDSISFKDMRMEIERIPFNKSNQFRKEFYKFIPNDPEYDYLLFRIIKNSDHQQFLSTNERRDVFHHILKTWIASVRPHFIWGDWFTTLKKEGDRDSRFNVWGYNYYSKRLVEAIGIERFHELINTNKEWNIEEFENGIILTGSPDPYSMKSKSRIKAIKILQLKERLAGIIEKKIPLIPVSRESPPKGVIE